MLLIGNVITRYHQMTTIVYFREKSVCKYVDVCTYEYLCMYICIYMRIIIKTS